MRRFQVCFAVGVGVLMLGWWAFVLAAGEVPEVRSEPVRLALHLVAEAMTALTLIAAGVGMARRASWARSAYLLGGGMLLYTVVMSPGYFAERGEWGPVVMFAMLVGLALVAVRGMWAPARS